MPSSPPDLQLWVAFESVSVKRSERQSPVQGVDKTPLRVPSRDGKYAVSHALLLCLLPVLIATRALSSYALEVGKACSGGGQSTKAAGYNNKPPERSSYAGSSSGRVIA